MSSSECEASNNPATTNALILGMILVPTLGIGFLGMVLVEDPGVMVTWFWIGIALSIVFLLNQLALNVKKLRFER